MSDDNEHSEEEVEILPVTESQFYMWRAVFAVAHVDGEVRPEEKGLMTKVLDEFVFSEQQRKVLEQDIQVAQDPMDMFRLIPSHEDQAKFFEFANQMVKVDGVFHPLEQEVLASIQRRHNYDTDVGDLAGHVDLQFEDDRRSKSRKGEDDEGSAAYKGAERKDTRDLLHTFRDAFIKKKI